MVAAVLRWQGADIPNQLFRIELFHRAGFTVWSSAWYGGHHTPGYSVLLPPLGAALGPAVVGGISVVVAAVCFDALLRRLPGVSGARAGLASLLFAAGTVTNLAIGRLAFALGLALGLAALAVGAGCWGVAAANGRARTVAAAALSCATALASPVAGRVPRAGVDGGRAECPLTEVRCCWAPRPRRRRCSWRSCSRKGARSRSGRRRSPSRCSRARSRSPRCLARWTW